MGLLAVGDGDLDHRAIIHHSSPYFAAIESRIRRQNLPEFLDGAESKQINVGHARGEVRSNLIGGPLIEIPQVHNKRLSGIQAADGLYKQLTVCRLRQPLVQAVIGEPVGVQLLVGQL